MTKPNLEELRKAVVHINEQKRRYAHTWMSCVDESWADKVVSAAEYLLSQSTDQPTDSKELLPCPFCGSQVEELKHNLVVCSNCKCPVSRCLPFTKVEWNTRATRSQEKKVWTAEELRTLISKFGFHGIVFNNRDRFCELLRDAVNNFSEKP